MEKKKSKSNYNRYKEYYNEKIPCEYCGNNYRRTYLGMHQDYCGLNPNATRTRNKDNTLKSNNYYKCNKENVLLKAKERRKNDDCVKCSCGAYVKSYYVRRHAETKKHQKYLESVNKIN